MKLLLTVACLFVIGATGWFGYQQYQDNIKRENEIIELKNEIAYLKGEVEELQSEVVQLEQQSLEGMVDNANKKLKDGLKSMFKAAEDEFQRLQETIDETFDDYESEGNPPQNTPNDSKQTHKT